MTFALRALAGAPAPMLAAFVDASDALDPRAAQTMGVDLLRLLWIRSPSSQDALRATDLLLGAGGFGLVVLSLCGTPPLWRRGQAWPRLARACERAGAALLVVSDHPVTQSFAAATLRLENGRAVWRRAPGGRTILLGQELRVAFLRNRLGSVATPAQIARWK
jgi:hypothetical protein